MPLPPPVRPRRAASRPSSNDEPQRSDDPNGLGMGPRLHRKAVGRGAGSVDRLPAQSTSSFVVRRFPWPSIVPAAALCRGAATLGFGKLSARRSGSCATLAGEPRTPRQLGRDEEAHRLAGLFVTSAAALWRGDEQAGPAEFVNWLVDSSSLQAPADIENLRVGLALAGLPA